MYTLRRITMEEIGGRYSREKTNPSRDKVIDITEYDNIRFLPRNYRGKAYPLQEISFYPRGRCREIQRKVFTCYGVAPNWEKATTSSDPLWKIEIPAVKTGSKTVVLPVPELGGPGSHLAVRRRIITRMETT